MKFIFAVFLLAGCAHTQAEAPAVKSQRQLTYDNAFSSVEQSIKDKAELYAKTMPGTVFLQLVDLEITDDAEAGVAVIEGRSEDRKLVGKLFVYLFCTNTKCRAVVNMAKVEAKDV